MNTSRSGRFTSIFLFTAILSLVYAHVVNAQATMVAGSASTSKTNYSPGVGSNRLLVVSVSNEANSTVRTVTSITWGGQNLVQASFKNNGGSGANDLRAEIWYLKEAGIIAASAYCNTFVVTWNGTITTEAFSVYTIKDVDQTTPVATTNGAAPVANSTVATLPATAAGLLDIVCYATATQASSTHTPAANYTENTDQVVGGTTALATASRTISVAASEAPAATWSASSQVLITAAVFNGVTATAPVTYYSRTATSGGAWDDNNSWTTNSDGSGGPLAANTWPRRQDNVVILPGHTITVNNVADNKSCGLAPDALLRSNVGPFAFSNIAMFYHTGDITIQGSFVVSAVEIMVEGYTHLVAGGTFSPTSFLVNTGYLEVDASTTLTGFNSMVLTGNSITVINTTSSFVDDLIIDHTDATLCGTGSAQLQNGAGSVVTTTNSGSLNQICSTFTITCTGSGCLGFPVTGTGGVATGNRGPGGVDNTNGTGNLTLWLNANQISQANNTNVTTWSDQSGYNNHANTVSGREPVFRTNILNANPVVRFVAANTDYLRVTNAASLRPNNLSAFVVGMYTNSTSQWSPFLIKTDVYDWTNGYGIVRENTSSSVRAFVSQWDDNFVTAALSPSTYTIVSAVYDNVNIQTYYNESLQGSDPFTANITNSNNYLYVGITPNPAGTGVQQSLDGDIAETILFNRNVTLAERIIIHNYLAAKYGLTLGTNDFYTMDNSGNGNYDFDVAGIGQASDGSNHKDARGGGIVRMTIQSPTSLTNSEFLLWGHNNASLALTTTGVGPGIQELLTRVWRVSEAGDVGPVALSFDLTSYTGTALGANLRLLIDRDGDGFADNDVTPISGGTYVGKIVTFGGVNLQTGDRFTLGNTDLSHPLPIELLSFSATPTMNSVRLDWATASERNNDYFVVQRSLDGESWEEVIEKKGAGDSREEITYTADDNNPHHGNSYYRLKQVDFDGRYSYSRVVQVEVESMSFQVYPNPSSGSFYLQADFDIDPVNVKLLDIVGKEVYATLRMDGGKVLLEASSAPAGVYVIQVQQGFRKQSLRVVIK